MSSTCVSGLTLSCSIRLHVITSRIQLATAPIVYPSETLAIAPESKVFDTPLYSLRMKAMKFISTELSFLFRREFITPIIHAMQTKAIHNQDVGCK